ncbi:MAG: [Fe-Fe] hydrogenase large subunit C-terminal domain-containing protein [Sphaerochaeta sp.]
MGYTAQWCKEQNSETKTLFIGPCLAKKVEAARMESVDGVMTFGELASLFLAKGIDVREMEGSDLGDTTLFEDCREFALSSGVASSVLRRLENPENVEVMCCEGGCISGPGAVVKPSVAKRLRGGNNASSPVKAMREMIARR